MPESQTRSAHPDVDRCGAVSLTWRRPRQFLRSPSGDVSLLVFFLAGWSGTSNTRYSRSEPQGRARAEPFPSRCSRNNPNPLLVFLPHVGLAKASCRLLWKLTGCPLVARSHVCCDDGQYNTVHLYLDGAFTMAAVVTKRLIKRLSSNNKSCNLKHSSCRSMCACVSYKLSF